MKVTHDIGEELKKRFEAYKKGKAVTLTSAVNIALDDFLRKRGF